MNESTTDQTPALGEQFALRLDIAAAMLPPASPDRILKKAVQAIHSYPLAGTHTVTTRKLMNALVAHAQDVFAKMTPEDRQTVKAVRGTPQFRIPIKRLLTMMGSEASNNYDRVYSALETIFGWEIRWNLMADGPAGATLVEEVTGRIISQWGKGVGDRAGLVTYELPFDTLMLLLEPFPFAQVDLRTVNQMGSAYAIALYENCARYIGTANRVTAVLPVEEWISIIAGQGKYQGNYKSFNKFALKPAQKWLETLDSCPFTVETRAVYGPRKRVIALQFKMHMKQQQTLGMDTPPMWDPRTIDVLKTIYQMSHKDIVLLSRMASEAEVQEALQRDSIMIARKTKAGEQVVNRAAYLRGILRNLQQGKPRDAEPEEDSDELSSKSVQDAVQRAKKKQQEFEEFRRARLRDELAELPQSVLQNLRDEFARERGEDGFTAKWIRAGWTNPHPGLMAAFINWVATERPEIPKRMLIKPEETDIAVWMMLHTEPAP